MLNVTLNKELYEKMSKVGGYKQYHNLKDYEDIWTLPKSLPQESSNTIPLSNNQDNSTVLGDRNLRWGHNSRGVVYKFNRGVLMYSKTGDKCLKVIPSSDITTHHADLMYQIATDEFNDTILDTHRPMENARLANEKGMTVLMFEGGLVQIYLPENPSAEVLEDIKRELEPRKDFIIASAINGKILLKSNDTASDAWTYDEYTEYLNSRIKELSPKKQELMVLENLTKEQYLSNLVKYIKENNITLKEYFCQLGKNYKEDLLDKIEVFEKRSPYMTPELISKLSEAKEEQIAEYFGNTMGEMIEEELKEINKPKLLSKEEYIEILNKYLEEHNISREEYFIRVANIHRRGLSGLEDFEKRNPFMEQEDIKELKEKDDDYGVKLWARFKSAFIDFLSPVKIMTLDECMGQNMKGLTISQGNNHSNMNITVHDPKTNQQTTIRSYNIEDGNYVNFAEYIFSLDETLSERYPDAEKVEMLDKNGKQIRRSDFCYATFDAIKNSSKTIIGDVYKDTFPDDWSEVYYQYRHSKKEQKIGDIDFACGLYVRKEDLDNFVKNYRLKITQEKRINGDTIIQNAKK